MCAVRMAAGMADWFTVTSGKGCALPSPLFIICMDKIAENASAEPEKLNELMFADDQSIIHQNDELLENHISSLNSS